LPASGDSVDQYLELPPEIEFRHGVRYDYRGGVKIPRQSLGAARVRGYSMIDRDIADGDVAILQSAGFDYLEHGKIVAIEKLGDEEGMGAWSLKQLRIDEPESSGRNEFADQVDFEGPVITLRSYNRQVKPWLLDRSGRYRVHGVLLRSLRPEMVRLVDLELLQDAIQNERDANGAQ